MPGLFNKIFLVNRKMLMGRNPTFSGLAVCTVVQHLSTLPEGWVQTPEQQQKGK
jgi:hypothetical protein